MATITTSQYLDSGTARTAGEAWIINSGAVLTIRTDTRVHSNAPVSNNGTFAAITINDGKIFIDATNVRWLPFNNGTGNVPAIGTNITQSGVTSSYLLGVWTSLSSSITTVGSAMPATGFLKFREVTGAFQAGALTGIGASATGNDVVGWIEIVVQETRDISIGRLGTFASRGDWFYLDNTNGNRDQIIQLPFNGTGTACYMPGVWIETAENSNVFKKWGAISNTSIACSYNIGSLGMPPGESDDRQSVCFAIGNGQIKLGTTLTQNATYATLDAQASTYASNYSSACPYTWSNNEILIYCTGGHRFVLGETCSLDFTSGSGVDGNYTVSEIIDGEWFKVTAAGSGTGGNVVIRWGLIITFTAHGISSGHEVYCNFTSGAGVSGTYPVIHCNSTGSYVIKYPHTAAISGNVSVIHTLRMTFTAHTLQVGSKISMNFTSGDGVDGIYYVTAIPTANTYDINYPHSVTTSGNVTLTADVGYVPPANCRVRIPNILTQQTTTTTNNVNIAPHVTASSRPEFVTTSAGNIDLEYFYNTGWYSTLTQAFSVRALHSSMGFDYYSVTECASAIELTDLLMGGFLNTSGGLSSFSNNSQGGVVDDCIFFNGRLTGGAILSITYSYNMEFKNCEFIWTCFNRSYSYVNITYGSNIDIHDCKFIGVYLRYTTTSNNEVRDIQMIDRAAGVTSTAMITCVYFELGCSNILVDGITFPDYPLNLYGTPIYIRESSDIEIRNIGTISDPIKSTPLMGSANNPDYIVQLYSNCKNIKVKNVYATKVRTGVVYSDNTSFNIYLENIWVEDTIQKFYGNTTAYYVITANDLKMRSCCSQDYTIAQLSVYGSHFVDMFTSATSGRYLLFMNDISVYSASQVNIISGNPRFNSAGVLKMELVNDEIEFIDDMLRQGYTGFYNFEPFISYSSGSTAASFNIQYQLDDSSGFSGTWKNLTAANLISETISAANGFRMKYKIKTLLANTGGITMIRVYMTTTLLAQQSTLYPLDSIATITISGIVSGSDVVFYTAGTSTVLLTRDAISGTTALYNYDTIRNVDIGIFKAGYVPTYIRNYTLTDSDVTLPITQLLDRNYV